MFASRVRHSARSDALLDRKRIDGVFTLGCKARIVGPGTQRVLAILPADTGGASRPVCSVDASGGDGISLQEIERDDLKLELCV